MDSPGASCRAPSLGVVPRRAEETIHSDPADACMHRSYERNMIVMDAQHTVLLRDTVRPLIVSPISLETCLSLMSAFGSSCNIAKH